MKFSENWLREFIDPPGDRAELLRRLTMAGLEVESVTALGAGLDGVRVAEILSAEPHPNADRLRVCQVSIGSGENLQIVCGAPNARVGLRAPLAMIGASLPNGTAIKAAELRGVASQGMLCSAKELALAEESNGLFELPDDAPIGHTLAGYLGLPDNSIEIKLTPNRSDCLGLRGLAFDVAAQFGLVVKDTLPTPLPATSKAQREVSLDAGTDCPRYLGRVIEGIAGSAQSPLWLREKLRRSGLRPINAVVDVTSYVMLELGQPMHAYDNDKLSGTISVRPARAGEALKLLDGRDVLLDAEFVTIADADNAVGLAGVMGGYESRVTDATQNVFLEAAHFAPPAIVGRARRLGMHTDASHRFERGVDAELPRIAIERASELLLSIVGGRAGPVTESVRESDLPRRSTVRLRRARLTRVLGMVVADVDVERILQGLGMEVETDAEGWRVKAPTRRFDIEIEEDLIEEIARVHGYDRVPMHAPGGELALLPRSETRLEPARFGDALVARDYLEAINYSFVAGELLETWSMSAGAIPLANPLSADLAVMRTSLLPGLVEALTRNRHRQQARVRLFEIGRVFQAGKEAPIETPRVAGVVCGLAAAEQWSENKRWVDFFDIKGDVEALASLAAGSNDWQFQPAALAALHPGRSAYLVRDGRRVGYFGNLHPRLAKALDIEDELFVFELDLDPLSERSLPKASVLSSFPSVRRDLALVVGNDVAWAEIEAAVRKSLGAALQHVFLFDQYSGPGLETGFKSLAMGLILQDSYRTLTDQDVDRFMAQAITALERDCQAKLRG